MSSLLVYHEDHIAAKGINTLSRYNMMHKFIPRPQSLKLPDAKAAVEKEKGMGNILKDTSIGS